MSALVEHLRSSSDPDAVLSALYGALATASEKMLRPNMAGAFAELSRAAADRAGKAGIDDPIAELGRIAETHLTRDYPRADTAARAAGDRGALRAVTWAKKVTAIHRSSLRRYASSGEDLVADGQSLWICEACGFVSLGPNPPDRCPVCKAPIGRFSDTAGGA